MIKKILHDCSVFLNNFIFNLRICLIRNIFIFALVYLLLDLEILVIYPYGLSSYENGVYGLIVVLLFIAIITAGFVFELGKGALKIDSRQSYNYFNAQATKNFINTFVENK